MDFVIASFLRQAGALPQWSGDAAAGPSTPLGTSPSAALGTSRSTEATAGSEELAALFAELLSSYSVTAGSVPDGSADTVGAGEIEAGPAVSETVTDDEPLADADGMAIATWQTPLMPWQWRLEPAPPVPSGQDAAQQDRAAFGSIAGEAVIARDAAAGERGPTASALSLPAETVTPHEMFEGADALRSAPLPEALEEGPRLNIDVLPKGDGSIAGVSTRGDGTEPLPQEPNAVAVSRAARALARALSSLDEQPRSTPAAPAVEVGRRSSSELATNRTARTESHGAVAPTAPPNLPEVPVLSRLASSEPVAATVPFFASGLPAQMSGTAEDMFEAAPTASRPAVDLASGLSLPAASDSGTVVRGTGSTVMMQGDGDRQSPLAAALAQTPAATEAPRADVPDQIVRAMRMQVKNGIGEVRLQLRPEFLGEVRIEIRVHGDRVNATLQVERQDVRHYIETTGQVLRTALAAQGLQLDELTVRDEERSGRDTRDQEQRRRQSPDRHMREEAEEFVFELPV